MARPFVAFCLALVLAFAGRSALAQPVAAGDVRAAQGVVRAQLDAFAHDDAARAFSYAAPSIRAMFGSAERFIAMVRAGYPVVYRAKGAAFLVPERLADDDIVQGVHLTDADGVLWLAVYRLERQPDGNWRINGCDVQPASGKTV